MRLCIPVVALCVPAALSCLDDDSAMGQMTQQQVGQPLTCSQMVFDLGNEMLCTDPTFSDGWCCASCGSLARRARADMEQELQANAGAVERARHLLASTPRSAPLHGRGDGMPLLALGTSGLRGGRGTAAVEAALLLGFRHLDSAIMYANHAEIRTAVERCGVPREALFITSKVPPEMMGYKLAGEAVERIRAELPGGYADLCLVHWPHTTTAGDAASAEWTVIERAGTWRALEDAFGAGVCRAIGVSNFMVKHLEELARYALVQPSVNQLELAPLAPLQQLMSYCQKRGIVMQGYGWRSGPVLEHPLLTELGRTLGLPTWQVVVLWFLQQGMVPLYMTTKLERLLEFAEVLDAVRPLAAEELAAISSASLEPFPWRYYTGKWAPHPWDIPVMADVGAGSRRTV